MKKAKDDNYDVIYNADHPARQLARELIYEVVEPRIGKELKGVEFYEWEDALTLVIAK